MKRQSNAFISFFQKKVKETDQQNSLLKCDQPSKELEKKHKELDQSTSMISLEQPVNRNNQSTNLVNFRAILNYRSEGDDHLKHHLEEQGRNKYITPQVQNKIISACGEIILKEIVNEVNNSRCFTVLADETTDIAVIEQLALCLLFSYGLPLCKQLQRERIDLKEAVNLTENKVTELKLVRSNCDCEFKKIFNQAKDMSAKLGIELTLKRIIKKQKNRANSITDGQLNVETYYKITVFLPYLDYFITELQERFLFHSDIFKGFECLFSKNSTEDEELSFKQLVEFYSPDLLQVALPISSASCERSFSAMRRILDTYHDGSGKTIRLIDNSY
ncbi:hypothetical protein QTP88_022667 [Uroleucon formosanum]